MSAKYLGKVNNIVTVEKLKDMIGMTQGTNSVTGDINFLKFNDNGSIIYIASNVISASISWNYLESLGMVVGKEISINGKRYICRLMSGSNGDPNVVDDSEWKRLIVDLVPSKSDSNWNNSTMCKETLYSDSNMYAIRRGGDAVDHLMHFDKRSTFTTTGFRPVLEMVEVIDFPSFQYDLGEIATFSSFDYNVNNLNGGNFNLVEKIDGKVIRTLSNQSGGQFSLEIEDFDSLTYGKHIIEIAATDITTNKCSVITSKFNKIKPPVQPIPTNSNLKQVVLHNKELEKEVSYQNFRLSEKLKERGIEVSENESLSSLIDKSGESKLPSWVNKGDYFVNAKPRPIKRGKSIASAIGSKIYCIGGYTGNDNSPRCGVDIYDTVENSWTTNEMTGYGITTAQSACSVGEFIYIPGKYCLRYDPLTNTYSEKAKMPKTSEYAGACAVDGFIYVIGGQYEYKSSGYTQYEILNKNQRYDPVTDTWAEMSTMPTERAWLTSSVVDGKIYCIGGKNDNNSTIKANECYDPITNTWTTKKSLEAYAVISKTSESCGEYIYIFGGTTSTVLNTLAYNTVTDSWTNKADIDRYRNHLCSASSNGKIYVIGGEFSTTNGDYSVLNNIYIP